MQGLPGLQTFLQALQPTQFVYTGNPFMPPQYPAMAPMPAQAPPLAQLPAPENHPIFQALVAAASEQAIKKINERQAPAAPANMSPEDEKVLVDVLKKGEENKWSMERVFQELSQKHGYTQEVWTRWFMTNVGKLYAIDLHTKAKPEPPLGGDGAGRSGGSSSQVAPETRSVSSKRPTSTVRFVQEQPEARSSRKVVITTPRPPAGSSLGKSSTTSSPTSSSNRTSLNSSETPSSNRPPVPQRTFSGPTLYSANRSKRGGFVPIVHDQTPIPWTDGSKKPSPPRSEGSEKLPLPRRTSAPTTTSSDSGHKLTDDEKIFFIHWLRWRLREGPLPDKETLFAELEAEPPHRPAEMWKRHWGAHCEVPDALYIEARKRVEREGSRGGSPRLVPPPAPTAREHRHRDSQGSESESDDDDDDDDDDDGEGSTYRYRARARKPSQPQAAAATAPAPAPAPAPKPKPKPMVRPQGGLPVTDEDLRAMARYRFAMGGDWDKQRFKIPRWQEFADRPENRKRSREAWYSITRDPKHSAAIDRYVQELERNETVTAAAAAPNPKAKAGLPTAAPQQTMARPAASSSGAARHPGDSKPALKRPAADLDAASASADGAGKDDPPSPSKRQKTAGDDVNPQADVDVVDLTADSDGDA